MAGKTETYQGTFISAFQIACSILMYYCNCIQKCFVFAVQAAKNQEEVDKLLNGLDLDRDSEVDFTEFMLLVTALTCACHNRFPKK